MISTATAIVHALTARASWGVRIGDRGENQGVGGGSCRANKVELSLGTRGSHKWASLLAERCSNWLQAYRHCKGVIACGNNIT